MGSAKGLGTASSAAIDQSVGGCNAEKVLFETDMGFARKAIWVRTQSAEKDLDFGLFHPSRSGAGQRQRHPTTFAGFHFLHPGTYPTRPTRKPGDIILRR